MIGHREGSGPRPKAVLFDLLTALLDSWTLWDAVAGSHEDGKRWRAAYLKNNYGTGRYRPYETLVREAAVETGLAPDLADRLPARYGELRPWPEVGEVLGALAGAIPLGVVTIALKRSVGSRQTAPGSPSPPS